MLRERRLAAVPADRGAVSRVRARAAGAGDAGSVVWVGRREDADVGVRGIARVCVAVMAFCIVGCAATHRSAPPTTRSGALRPVPVSESGIGAVGRTWNVLT